MITDLPKLYTEKDIAIHLDVCEETVARERRAGKISFTRVRGQVRYTAAHLAAYLERQECGTTSRPGTKSGTSAGPSPMDAQTANRLAREIAKKPTRPLRSTSSSTTGRRTNG